ncbi:MAG: Spy/CpxP family protein refolding chaperone [Beijerinckiaceae bacterium]|nr:Spy/CpxP family protein refolding chaperone [Beijerinckiaceae bacterium]
MSKHVPVGLVLGALLGSAAFLAPVTGFAQGAPAAAPPQTTAAPAKPAPAAAEDKEKERADHKAFLDAKIAALHAGLELTAAQAPLWTPVEAAIRGLAQGQEKLREAHRDGAALSPLERLKRRAEGLGESAKGLKALTDATEPFVASLDAPQKEHLPKLLEEAFKGHKLLHAAFNVASADDHDGGHEGARDEHRDGDEGHHAWHHEHRDGDGDEEHHWHHHHHHHHHWGHHHGDHDEGNHEHHGDHDRDSHSEE